MDDKKKAWIPDVRKAVMKLWMEDYKAKYIIPGRNNQHSNKPVERVGPHIINTHRIPLFSLRTTRDSVLITKILVIIIISIMLHQENVISIN